MSAGYGKLVPPDQLSAAAANAVVRLAQDVLVRVITVQEEIEDGAVADALVLAADLEADVARYLRDADQQRRLRVGAA